MDEALSQPILLTAGEPEWHEAFLAMLPKIIAHLRVAF